MGRGQYEYELAEAIDATSLTDGDGVTLGPTDAKLAADALRFVAGLNNRLRAEIEAQQKTRGLAPIGARENFSA